MQNAMQAVIEDLVHARMNAMPIVMDALVQCPMEFHKGLALLQCLIQLHKLQAEM
jgi:hypothetical protein